MLPFLIVFFIFLILSSVSVPYKMKGEFVYPEDLELDDDLQDVDFDVAAEISLSNR